MIIKTDRTDCVPELALYRWKGQGENECQQVQGQSV